MKDNSISIAKGIGIILMLIGHAGCPGQLGSFIYIFHMPLFFFLSGYCFKERHLNNFKDFAIKRIKGIYLPFIKYSLLFLLLHNVFYHLNIYNDVYGYNGAVSQLYDFNHFVKRATKIVTEMNREEQLLGGFWFLRVLFCTSFLGYAFLRFVRNSKVQIITLVLVCIGVIFLAPHQTRTIYIQTLHLSFFALIFFIAGKETEKLQQFKPNNIYINSLVTLIFFSGTLLISIFYPSGMTTDKNIIIYTIGALSGILMTKNLSNHIQHIPYINKILVYIGNNTLPILAWHLLCFKLISLLIIHINNLPIENLAHFPVIPDYSKQGWWIAYTIVGLCVPLAMTFCSQHITEKIKIIISKRSHD